MIRETVQWLFICGFIFLIASFSLSAESFVYRPGFITNSPHTSLTTNESVVFAGDFRTISSCGPEGYLIFAPFGEAPIVTYSDREFFNSLVEIDGYEWDVYAEYFLVEEICQNETSNVLVSVYGFSDDTSLPVDFRLVLTFSPLGELLDNYTISVPQGEEIIIELNCTDIANSVVVSPSDLIFGENFQNGEQIVDASVVGFDPPSALYILRNEQNDPPQEMHNLGISAVNVESFVYFESSLFGESDLCNSLMSGISVNVTNFGSTEVCSFELSLDRGKAHPSGWCDNYYRQTLIIDECIPPGETAIINVDDWPTADSPTCNENLCAFVFSPNNNRDSDNSNDSFCIEAELDSENCLGFPCSTVGEIPGSPGALDESCECVMNANCNLDIEINSSIECGDGFYTVTWEISGGEPVFDSDTIYSLDGQSINQETLIQGETYSKSYGLDNQHIYLHVTDGYDCYTYWELEETVACPSGIDDLNESDVLRVYPNPVQDILSLTLKQASSISIYDATGRMVLTENYSAGNKRIDFSEPASGLYFLVSESSGVLFQTRLFKL